MIEVVPAKNAQASGEMSLYTNIALWMLDHGRGNLRLHTAEYEA